MDTNHELQGFLLINKPPTISSYDCIRWLKKILPKKTRIGHGGTLDVFAQGLLVVAIGRKATQQLSTVIEGDKKYKARAKLGQLTDTLDLTGTTLISNEKNISLQDLTQSIISFQGTYQQTPPLYSALKHQGQPLYALARSQQDNYQELTAITQAKTKEVTIHAIHLHSFSFPFFTIEVSVSKGTYIRSLINDIAQRCDTHATTYELTRIASGSFTLEQATPLHHITTLEHIYAHLISTATFQKGLFERKNSF
jgi:tRNA pseudouridine55 synthase